MLYGNSSTGYSYSPDRSRDIDRFNPSTRSNYSTSYNPYGYYSPESDRYANINSNNNKGNGWYDGAGRYHKD